MIFTIKYGFQVSGNNSHPVTNLNCYTCINNRDIEMKQRLNCSVDFIKISIYTIEDRIVCVHAYLSEDKSETQTFHV